MNKKAFLLTFVLQIVCFSFTFGQEEYILRQEADSLMMYRGFEKAIEKYKQSENLRENRENNYRIAICFCYLGEIDSAGYYYDKALSKKYYSGYYKLPEDPNLQCLKEHSDYKRFVYLADTLNYKKTFTIVDSNLFKEVMRRKGLDQYVRNKRITEYIKDENLDGLVWAEVDSLNMLFLDSLLNVFQKWPGYDILGEEGDRALWLFAQHSDNFVEFQEKCYKYLLEAEREHNITPNHIAYLYDRIRINKGLKQRFGTQNTSTTDTVVIGNLEDEKNVDAYRNYYRLPPLSEYIKALQERQEKMKERESQK